MRISHNTVVVSGSSTFVGKATSYRYYFAAGLDHTIIADDEVYLEDSAGGLRFDRAGWMT